MERVVIAIDGPAGAGKSTISKLLAQRLNIEYIDTGAMYRAVTLKMLKNNIPVDSSIVKNMLRNTDIKFVNGRLFLDGIDVSEEIRKPEVTSKVSEVSAMKVVREKLVDMQRSMAGEISVIMDGRDIGTNVLKDANFKIFLTASVEERASRRQKELFEKGIDISFEEMCSDIKRRDNYDSTRKINPLCKADDAVLVDTTSKEINEVVEVILEIVNKGKVL